jgi:geranylgeranyl diphosphate synthase, type I
MALKEELARLRARLEERQSRFLADHTGDVDYPEARDMVARIDHFNLRGGKKVRGSLVVMGYRCVGGTDEDRILDAAISVEFLQDFLLFHDDIMDESMTRRGGPSIHCEYRSVHEARGYGGDAGRYGESMGILAGDLAESFGVMALSVSDFPCKDRIRALARYARILRDTGYGQVMDIMSGTGRDVVETDVLRVHRFKTAKYTLEGPLHIGAMLGGADDGVLARLSDYAIPVGIAFQLQDDILGLFGTEEEIGKPVTSDLEEGKRTLLMVHALEAGSDDERQAIMEHLGRPGLRLDEVDTVRNIVRSTGALDRSQTMAREFVEEGVRALDGGWLDADVAAILCELGQYVIRRSY